MILMNLFAGDRDVFAIPRSLKTQLPVSRALSGKCEQKGGGKCRPKMTLIPATPDDASIKGKEAL